jgi:immunity protein 8 of polymorphic toxin system
MLSKAFRCGSGIYNVAKNEMAIELHDYDVISDDFEALTGTILFVDLNEIPYHQKSEMLFTLTIGNKGSVAGSDFKTHVSIAPKFKNRKHGFISKCTFEYGDYNPEKILKDINDLIASCDRGTLQASVNELRKVLDWEYEGMADQ